MDLECRGGAAGPAGPVLAGQFIHSASPQLKMRGVATLDDFVHPGACALRMQALGAL